MCFSLSGRVAEEGLDSSAPDSSEEDILFDGIRIKDAAEDEMEQYY